MQKIKILTLNVGFYMLGDVFSKNNLSNMESICRGILERIVKYNPDIICIQEDLLVTRNYYPIFESIYNEYGYKVANYCQSHYKLLENYRDAKLGNVIYSKIKVKKSININNLDSDKKGCMSSPRCASSIDINGIKLVNLHLCGGRFDDKDVAEKKLSSKVRENEMRNVLKLKPEIILGDFNAGYNDDYSFMEKQVKNFNRENYKKWMEGVIEYMFKEKYKSAYKYYKTGKTTMRGKFVIDWVFYKNVKIDKTKIIRFWGKNIKMLTDHHALLVEVFIPT